jgi:hypothetical protein
MIKILSINFVFFVIGITGVWITTHNWLAMFWTFIAAVHITFTNKTQITV